MQNFTHLGSYAQQALRADLDRLNSMREEAISALDEEESQRTAENIDRQIADAERVGNEKKANELRTAKEQERIEAQKAAKIDAINAEFDRKEKERKRKAAIGQKAANVANATINAFAAYVSTLAMQPGGLASKSVSANIALGFGLSKAAIMAATPIPAFAQGGTMITDGPQMFLAGDNPSGRERIDITPLDDEVQPSGNTYNFYGIQDLAEARNQLIRQEGASAWR